MTPFTQKMLMDWAGPDVFRDAKSLFERGAVQVVSFEPPFIRGTVSFGNREIKSASKVLDDGTCENLCPCRDNVERGIICAHVIALGLALIRRANDPELQRKQLEEARKAARMAKVDADAFLKRDRIGNAGTVPATLRLELQPGWIEACRTNKNVPIRCLLELNGATLPIDQAPRGTVYGLTERDESIMFVLEDISEGPARGRLELLAQDFYNLLALHMGKPIYEAGRADPLVVNAAKMTTVIRMDLDRENGELLLAAHTELPFLKPLEFPIYVVSGKNGYAYGAGNFWPLNNVLPGPLRAIYEKPISITRPAVPRFFQTELPLLAQHVKVESDLSLDLFTIEPGSPSFRLVLRGSPASIAGTLYARYDDIELIAGKADSNGLFSHPDPNDLLRYTVRNPEAEAEALRRMGAAGFVGEAGDALSAVVGVNEVNNFLGRVMPELRRRGWRLEMEGRVKTYVDDEVDFATPVVRVNGGEGSDWFEVDYGFEDSTGASISPSDVQRAILKGQSYIERGGRTILLDGTAVEQMSDIFKDCSSGDGSKPGSFRLPSIYASYVSSSLNALDGVDLEATPAWQDATRRQNRDLAIEPVPLDEPLNSTLRSYQKEGVYWLRFMEKAGFCGILADEMGLGKTLQTLTWIQLKRARADAGGKPSLIVCPTSLVDNWIEEAAKFTPHLRAISITGSDRHTRWVEVPTADLVITSYALLRRDIEQYAALEFSAVVLDEAQHIKNRSTQNAIAAKRLRSAHRLVLTGTPIENSVSDLWSIMDFLMPGYMGSHESFKTDYEQPIMRADEFGERAQSKLRRKLHPFLLRRLKQDVARDLPPKIEKVSTCPLSPDQQVVYRELLEASQRKICSLVEQQGFQKSRMEILKTLLRLRQACCHLDLLKLPGLTAKEPSAKMELFFELMDEALDGGHRVLVFSQFVSMLSILREALAAKQVQYCYLDGATQERLKIVHQFNTNRDIPIFLISLKAGGSGLNLTGADMVIHYDPWWNPAVEDQATDRAHRIGQQRTVYSVKLITKNTVEEKVLALQKRKKEIIDATLETDEQVMGKLSWDDVRELLSL
jgi:superfamily II DNA or RNA helicase